jgi:hypothetical protein
MTDYPITDPTLSAFHAPVKPHERIYFSGILDPETHEERYVRVVSPVIVIPAPLIIDIHYADKANDKED